MGSPRKMKPNNSTQFAAVRLGRRKQRAAAGAGG